MSSINARLPTELYRHIVQHLYIPVNAGDPEDDRRPHQHLVPLLFTSRVWNNEAERLIYACIIIRNNDDRDVKLLEHLATCSRVALIVKSMVLHIDDPTLGSFLQQAGRATINLKHLFIRLYHPDVQQIMTDLALSSAVRQADEAFEGGFRLEHLEYHGIKKSPVDAQEPTDEHSALFFLTQPQLTELTLSIGSAPPQYFSEIPPHLVDVPGNTLRMFPGGALKTLTAYTSEEVLVELLDGRGVRRLRTDVFETDLLRRVESVVALVWVAPITECGLERCFPNLEYLEASFLTDELMVEQVGRLSRLQKLKVWIPAPGSTANSLLSLSTRLFNACPTLGAVDGFVARPTSQSRSFEGWEFRRLEGNVAIPLSDRDEDEWRKWEVQ